MKIKNFGTVSDFVTLTLWLRAWAFDCSYYIFIGKLNVDIISSISAKCRSCTIHNHTSPDPFHITVDWRLFDENLAIRTYRIHVKSKISNYILMTKMNGVGGTRTRCKQSTIELQSALKVLTQTHAKLRRKIVLYSCAFSHDRCTMTGDDVSMNDDDRYISW